MSRFLDANGTEQVDTFDARHRLTDRVNQRTDGTVVTEHHYTLSDDNRRLTLWEADGRNTEWTYDALDRLVDERVTDPVRGNRVTTFEYDAVGNRLRRETTCNSAPCGGELTSGVTTYSYDANDRLLEKVGPDGTTTYAYDANGNQVEKSAFEGLTTYTYNTDNRLVSAQTPAYSLAFEYDLEGIRQSRIEDGSITDYLTDANRPYAQVIEERDGGGVIQASYVHGHDLLSQSRSGIASFYHTDGLGSTRALSNSVGIGTGEYGYSAYGQITYESTSRVNSHLYTGEQFDAALTQYYLRARYYRPDNGRLNRMDGVTSLNKLGVSSGNYGYTAQNPINDSDPSGNLSLLQQATTLTVLTTLTNIAITDVAIRTIADSGPKPDGIYLNIEYGRSGLGADFAAGGSVIYDIKQDNMYGYLLLDVGTNPASVFKLNQSRGFAASAGFIWNMSAPSEFGASWGGMSAVWPMGMARALNAIYRPSPISTGTFWAFMDDAGRFSLLDQRYGLQFGSANLLGGGPAFAGITTGGSVSTKYLNWDLGGRLSGNFSEDFRRSMQSVLASIDEYTPSGLHRGIRSIRRQSR